MDVEPNVDYEEMIIKKEKRRQSREKSRQNSDWTDQAKAKSKKRKTKHVSFHNMDTYEDYENYDLDEYED